MFYFLKSQEHVFLRWACRFSNGIVFCKVQNNFKCPHRPRESAPGIRGLIVSVTGKIHQRVSNYLGEQ